MSYKESELQFDFDHWATIARDDPDRFELMREALLEEMIQQSPDNIRQRMEGLQWKINQVRNRSANPMTSCLRISRMMWDSVLGEQGLLTALETPEKILRPLAGEGIDKVVQLKPGNGGDPN